MNPPPIQFEENLEKEEEEIVVQVNRALLCGAGRWGVVRYIILFKSTIVCFSLCCSASIQRPHNMCVELDGYWQGKLGLAS